jgi:hypothetical protein
MGHLCIVSRQCNRFSHGIKQQVNIRWIMHIGFYNKGITTPL